MKMSKLKFNHPSMTIFSRLPCVLLAGLTLTVVTGCGGGESGDPDQIDRPPTLSGTYIIRHVVSKDTCSTGRTKFNNQLTITQSGSQISGEGSGILYSGVASVSPYGFVVKNTSAAIREESTQISIVYSDTERKFNAIAVFDFMKDGKACRIETKGEVGYYP